MLTMIFNFIKKYWREILLVILILISFISIRSCNDNAREAARQAHNVEASLDSVRYYRDKNGELYAEKMAYIVTQGELEKINKEMYDKIQALDKKLLAALNAVTVVHDTIDLTEKTDVLVLDTTDIPQFFNIPISDKILSANLGISYYPRLSEIHPLSFDYTFTLPIEVYIGKDYAVRLKSLDNVKFSDVTAFVDPILTTKVKPKRWSLGLQSGVGFNYNLLKPSYSGVGIYVGVGVSYNLFSF